MREGKRVVSPLLFFRNSLGGKLAPAKRLKYILFTKEIAMTLEYNFLGRTKLIKGHTYPIKRGELDKALEDSEVSELETVTYSSNYDDQDLAVMRVFLAGESREGYWTKEKPVLSVYSIPSHLSTDIKSALKKENILLRISRWLKKLESASNIIRDINQEIVVYYNSEIGTFFFKNKQNKMTKLP